MRSVEAEGDSIDAAIEAALQLLDATRDRVEIEILSNAARGLFGLGGRKAKVRATLRQSIVEQVFDEQTGPVSRQDDLGRLAAKPNQAPRPPMRTPAPPRPRQTTHAMTPPDQEAAERACEVLRNIVAHLGVGATIESHIDDDAVVLQLMGDASGVLIGRKGQMLDALEYIVSRIVSRDRTSAVHVIIDCERYRERRREALQELARRMGEEAKRKKRVVKLNAMSPRDRRIVHLILQQDPSITTRSSGKGHFRKLIIIPSDRANSPAD
jgi:spoIIIJ-associated protein